MTSRPPEPLRRRRGPPPLGEFGRIAHFFAPLARDFPGAFGLADDAAILAPPSGQELVVTTDAVVAGVHFLPDDPAGDVARKALRVNLSDLAAKGARPLAYTLTLALSRDVGDAWVEEFAGGLADDQAQYAIALAGGDSVSTAGPAWVSVTAFGLVPAGRMVRRNGARPGDLVFVTGAIGDAALGLMVARGGLIAGEADARYLVDRYRLPRPRSALAQAVSTHATAALDVSDGLAADFGHLCAASGVRGELAADRIPLSPAASRALAADPLLRAAILGGGDDYEILLTARPGASGALAGAASAAGVALTEVGRVKAGAGDAVILDAAGRPVALDRPGWTHA